MKTLQLFETGADTVYTIEETSRITDVPRHQIAVYYRHGLVSTVAEGWLFDDEAIRTLRRIEYLRSTCHLNIAGIKLVLELMREVEQLSAEVRFLQRR
jgi:DNA-binding transcriptional MerR regulator